MRILTLTNLYPPHAYGGYELSCRDVMIRFAAAGHEVTVLTSSDESTGESTGASLDEREAGVYRGLRLYWRDHVLLAPSMRERAAIERHNHRALAAALDTADTDVVSVWNMGAMSLGLLTAVAERRIPLVLVVCDDWLVYGPKLDAWFRVFDRRPRLGRLVEGALRIPTHLPDLGEVTTACFVSDFVRRRAEAESRWRFATSTVVYSGIERSDFAVADSDDEVPEPDDWDWRLLYVGRLDPRKGLDTLVDAMARLPSRASLEIVGRGEADYERSLRQRITERRLEARVTLTSSERSDLAETYTRADVVVFPSEWDEPFGLVPVEAMACDTPVVATGTGGSREFLADGRNCLLFPPGDASRLVEAVERLSREPSLRRELVEGGRITARELDTDRLAAVLERWHVAAATEFSDGRPADRPSIDEHLG